MTLKKDSWLRTRWGQIAGAVAVILIPALLATYLSNSQETPRTPKVTAILSSSSADPKESSKDSPAAGAGSKALSITVERGSRTSLGRIQIPAIGIRTKYFEGVTDEAVVSGPGHWPGTPWPGRPGNSVFAGHRTTFTRPFEDLDLLEMGARIRAGVSNEKLTTYRVFKTTVVPEAEYVEFVLRQPRNKRVQTITLFACTPKGSRTHRIVVQAKAMA